MTTDPVPRGSQKRTEFRASEGARRLVIPGDDRLRAPAGAIKEAMASGKSAPVRDASMAFLETAARFYDVPVPGLRVLAARPLKIFERSGYEHELFGDYDPSTNAIRVWMKTPRRKVVTSFGTFFSTLCHELCHHLDIVRLGFPSSPHTTGFYERAHTLYCHALDRPRRDLPWIPQPRGRWAIDWAAYNRRR